MTVQARLQHQARQLMVWALVALGLLWILRHGPFTERYDVPVVSVQEAKRLIDGGAVVVDVRGKKQFDERHIPGALSVPLAVMEQTIPVTLAFAKSRDVVVYCGDGVTIGPKGTHLLNQAGFAKAVNLGPGIQGWADAGLPVK